MHEGTVTKRAMRSAQAVRHPTNPKRSTLAAPRDCRPRLIVKGEDDIVQAVKRARETGAQIRAIGSGGSKNGNYRTPGHHLDLRACAGVTALSGNRITVQAGMTVARLQSILEQQGLALPTPGEWTGATVGGAVSTGTHGGSTRHGCFATSLVEIRLVTGRGSVMVLRRGSPDFDHAGVSLGLLGVVSELTFECADRFDLAIERRLVPFDRFLRDDVRALGESEFCGAVWFPEASRVITFAADRCNGTRPSGRRPNRYGLTSAALAAFPAWRKISLETAGRVLNKVVSGPSAEILSPINTSGRGVQWLRRFAPRLREVEFAVPLTLGGAALQALEQLLRAWPRTLKLAVGIRATAGDSFSLSPCYGHDVLWISVFYNDHPEFTAALADLFARFDSRCHWGKNMALTPAQLRSCYPRWDAFQAARARFDPDGVFQNPFTREYVQ